MNRLWHLLYWPALALVVLCLVTNFVTTMIHSLAQELAEHCDKRLRKSRP